MTKKNIAAIFLTVLVVAGFYFYLYRDSFRKPSIQIFHTFRPKLSTLFKKTPDGPDDSPNTIVFALGGVYKITSIKVLSVTELSTNKYAHPLWELTSSSNSAPIRAFAYGSHIHGMHASVKGATADPLTPDVPYRLVVEAGPFKGEHDFTIKDNNHIGQ